MHALIVTVRLSRPVEEVLPLIRSYDRSLENCDGHIAHYWLNDRQEIGLFHLFEDEAAATRYLDSRVLATLTAHHACVGNTYIRMFDVLGDGQASAAKLETPESLHVDEAIPTPA